MRCYLSPVWIFAFAFAFGVANFGLFFTFFEFVCLLACSVASERYNPKSIEQIFVDGCLLEQ